MGTTTVIIAVAGAGKTEFVAQRIAAEPDLGRTMLLTYLIRNQIEDSARIVGRLDEQAGYPRVMGWFSFLLNEIVRPYAKLCWPNIEVGSLCKGKPHRDKKGSDRYFTRSDDSDDAYSETLAQLAVKVIRASNGAAISRLESIVDAIYIDETQDLGGNDLVILEGLMASKINLTIVCDPRQAVVKTSRSDTKYRKYRDDGIADFFVEKEKEDKCAIEWKTETYRFTQEIAKFSDTVIRHVHEFPDTVSNVKPEGYSGLYLIDKKDIERYANEHHATVLRLNKKAGSFNGIEVANFGECKGMTRRDVVILATIPIEKMLKSGTKLKPESARKLYVAITRAQQSVAIAVNSPDAVYKSMLSPSSAWYEYGFRLEGSAANSS